MTIKKKYFLAPKELIPFIKEYVTDIKTYEIIEINPRNPLQEIVVEAKLFSTMKEAEENGFKDDPDAALQTYELADKIITILV